ncbi:MAG: FAD-binding oxidoreductase [Candidatus Lokiarchaeota archaeon]|nr:FAD-binding oxidoreductase [Candidatus Lokiarchaeota archaeon]
MNQSNNSKVENRTIKKIGKQDLESQFLEFISSYHVSTNPYELESASADLTSLPSYHYKFKKQYLASHIIRPANVNELSRAIKKCRERNIPVTIRAAGTSCFSSATPSKGGVIIDMRRLNKVLEVNKEKMIVKVESGISWLNLIEALADYGLEPKTFPTSFKTSCVGGFIATPGKAGIGVVKYGPMEDSINSLDFVKPDGSIVKILKDSNDEITLKDIIGTYGIYGAISSVELSVTTLKTSLEIIGYGFDSIGQAFNFYEKLKVELPNKPLFLSISERDFEKYSHINFPERDWLVWAAFYDDPEATSKSVSDVKYFASKMNAFEVDSSYLKEKWRDISDAEVSIGLSARNLIFQEYWISDMRLESFIDYYVKERRKYKFPTASYAISGEKGWTRVKIFGLTDISKPREFFTVKAFLHDLSVKAFTQGDRLYTIGIVNSFYLIKYKPEEVMKWKILKDKLDPKDLFNSYRLTKARMKFWRVALLFNTAKILYKIF